MITNFWVPSEPQNHVKLSETFQILPEPSRSDQSSTMQPCSYFQNALWNLSNAEQPSTTSKCRTFAKPTISGTLQYLQNALQLFPMQLSWATFLSNIFDCTGWLRWYLLFLCWGLVAQQVLFLLQGLTAQVHGTIVFKKCVGGILPSRANSSSGKSSSKSVFGRV